MNIVGNSLPRVDAYQKVTGEAHYANDIKIPGALVGKVLRSPYAHAFIRNINVEKAKKLKGVIDVFTNKDVPQKKYNPAAYPPTIDPTRMNLIKDVMIFTDKARYVGDPVAAVVAVDEETAEEALSLIEVEYELIEAYFNPFDAMGDNASLIHEYAKNNIVYVHNMKHGDIDKGFKEADLIIEEEFSTSRISPAPIEPTSTSIAMPSINGDIKIISSTQTPHLSRQIIADTLGLNSSKIRLIKPFTGGGFGGRHGLVNELQVAFMSSKVGRAIKLSYSREESFISTSTRHPAYIKVKSGIKKDGSLTARQIDMVTDTGAYVNHGVAVTRMGGMLGLSIYQCENILFNGTVVYSNNPPAGGIRGYGSPQGHFAVESHTDTIARKLNIDPLEYRLKHHIRKGDINYHTGLVIDSCGLEECINQGAKKIFWFDDKAVNLDKHKKRGKGMAIMIHISGTRPNIPMLSTARITINNDGYAYLSTAAAEIGQGVITSVVQVAAEALGFKYEHVKTDNHACVDTMIDGIDMGAYASRSFFANGIAVKKAATEARRKLLEHASKMLKIDSDKLTIEDSMIKDIHSKKELLTAAQVAYNIMYQDNGEQVITIGVSDINGSSPPFAAEFAEVEVDTETGNIEVINFVAAQDVGYAISPSIVEGQIEGGVHMGLGYALMENVMVGDNGKVLNPEFANYKILTAKDMPKLQTVIVEDKSPIGAYGAKGVGEPTVTAIAPAVANAVYDAIGVRIKELPITPDKILKALAEK